MQKFEESIFDPTLRPTINQELNAGHSPEQIYQLNATEFGNLTDEELFKKIEDLSISQEPLPLEMVRELKRRKDYTEARLSVFQVPFQTQTKDIAGIKKVVSQVFDTFKVLGEIVPRKSPTSVVNPVFVFLVMQREGCTYKEAETMLRELLEKVDK